MRNQGTIFQENCVIFLKPALIHSIPKKFILIEKKRNFNTVVEPSPHYVKPAFCAIWYFNNQSPRFPWLPAFKIDTTDGIDL